MMPIAPLASSLLAQISDLPTPLVVVCHDAGAANLIFSWLHHWLEPAQDHKLDWRFVLDGPARQIWLAKPTSQGQLFSDLPTALAGAHALLSGTGWASHLEHQARVHARSMGVPSIAVIDHWVNYQARFIREGVTALPDQIWVADPYAAAVARACFPAIDVLTYPNHYLTRLAQEITPLSQAGDNLLYVLEPLRQDWGRGIAGEFQALDFFISKLNHLTDHLPHTIRLRPHPSDPTGKYDAWIANHASHSVQLDQSDSLAQAISQAKWVVGAETFAMVVALAAGRKVYSSLPPWTDRCRLPFKDIVHLRDVM